MREILGVVLAMLFAGVAQSAPITGVVFSYDQTPTGLGRQWTGHLVNVSHKYITYVGIGARREGKNQPFAEMGNNWPLPGDFPPGITDQPGFQTFAPGTTRDVPIGPFEDGVIVTVNVVVYGDLTAEYTDEDAFKRVIEDQRRGLRTRQKVIEVITKSASPEQAATELEKLADAVPQIRRHNDNNDSHNLEPQILLNAADELRAGIDPQEIVKRTEESINSEITKEAQP